MKKANYFSIFFIILFTIISLDSLYAQIPSFPSNLRGYALSPNKIILYWHDNSNDELGFRIKRTNGTNVIYDSVAANDTMYTDNRNISALTTCYYQVCAFNTFGSSNWTVSVPVTSLALGSTVIGIGEFLADYPFTTYWMDSKTDILVKRSEITESGYSGYFLYGIKLNVASYSSQIMNGFNLKIQLTNDSVLTGFKTTGWTTVYDNLYTVQTNGWISFPFYFLLGNTQNLLLEICFDNSSYTNSSYVFASDAPGCTWHQSQDNSFGCSFLQGSLKNIRPNIMLYWEPDNIGKISEIIPGKFSLFQNYPNPFNPTTKIKFDISNFPLRSRRASEEVGVGGMTTLKIYDILGKEIQTLLNEQLQPGSYEVTFDGSNLPSGIYFYQLRAGEFIDTKKLILLK